MTNLIRRAISAMAKFQHLRIRLNEQRLGSPAGPLSVEFIDWLPGFRRLLRLLFLSSVSVHRRFFRRAVSKPRKAIQIYMFYGSVLPAFARSARSSNTSLFSA